MKILIVALQKNNRVTPATFELIEASKRLNGEIISCVLAEDAQPLGQTLVSRGGGKVLAVSNPALKHFNDEIYGDLLGLSTQDMARLKEKGVI